jgi:DNA polymerase-3 subunit beta
MQVTIPQSTIKAVAYAMAANDIRYYLNGMLLQHNGEETRLVATDGSRLNAARIEHKDGILCDPIEVIIPDMLIKVICKAKAPRHDKSRMITLTIDGDKVSSAMPDGTESVAKAIDGRFPDYSRVIPESFSGESAQYNPKYMMDAVDSIRTYWGNNGATPGFCYNGTNAGGISVDGFVAIAMPWRADVCDSSAAWAKAEMLKPEKSESVA